MEINLTNEQRNEYSKKLNKLKLYLDDSIDALQLENDLEFTLKFCLFFFEGAEISEQVAKSLKDNKVFTRENI